MSNKREREYERRRYEKWQARQAEAKARQRRQRIVAGSVVGALVVVIGVVAAVVANGSDDTAGSPTEPGDTTTATTPAAEATNSDLVPDPALAEDREWTGEITLGQGALGISLDGAAAPQAVANFVTLAQDGFFDGTTCHRLTTEGIYVLQCGDPEGTGLGGPGYSWGPVENAPADDVYPAGTIAMARQSGNGSSMGSQFFLVYEDSKIPSDGAGGYTVFGQVTSGLDVVTAIADAGTADGSTDGSPVSDVIIEGVKIQ
ncbi:peptidylprolyl isomerase [Cellulomonas palmilytica]|uniref:peptidylprolyl isomerase n=1 Tax=Cellulomonas palmilytica TaxID=2608402 RepID=UPI001F311A23|nr:peptidylprolyl isomerase [Cellulomonas palmilytica]UJP39091.1 peptidylprolyl isomerase [Cellulomonas palmilytica]